MKKKYSWNHNDEIFEIHQMVTQYIPNEDCAMTDNYQLLCMIKEISYKRPNRIQTKFSFLD